MPVIKLTKQVIESAKLSAQPYELRDTDVKGFLCKITPSGRKVFMLAYRNRHGQKRKPAIGPFGIYTVQEAREVARKWLREAHAGSDPSRSKSEDRTALLMSICANDSSAITRSCITSSERKRAINSRSISAYSLRSARWRSKM